MFQSMTDMAKTPEEIKEDIVDIDALSIKHDFDRAKVSIWALHLF